jgi:glycosyltransferase-like protein LARGE
MHYYRIDAHAHRVDWVANGHYSGVYGLMKLVLHDILPVTLERVVVLDTDLLATVDITQLWMTHLNTDVLFALVDNQSDWYVRRTPLHTPWPARGRGVNTGVIVMNLERMRQHVPDWTSMWMNVTRACVRDYGAAMLGDQVRIDHL